MVSTTDYELRCCTIQVAHELGLSENNMLNHSFLNSQRCFLNRLLEFKWQMFVHLDLKDLH